MSTRRRLAASTAAFGSATALSRLAGVVREQAAAYYFRASPTLGAFLIAFNVPNLIRSLVADTAISAAFVPVFVDMREQGREPEAWRVASIVMWLAAAVLGGLSAVLILLAPWIMPLFVPGDQNIDPDLVVSLSRYLFPIVVVLGMTGVVTGILNSYDIFGVPAFAPVAWNAIIIVSLVAFARDIDAYAIGVLVATVAQFLIPLPLLRGRSKFVVSLAWRHPEVQRILRQMLPVTIGLGLINFNLTIDLAFATIASPHADADLNYAFRLFMLPQGLFSVAVTVVLFPEISRLAARSDTAGFARRVANGARAIVSLQEARVPTQVAVGNLILNLILDLILVKPFGATGIALSTAAVTTWNAAVLVVLLRRRVGTLHLAELVSECVRIAVATIYCTAAAAGVWWPLDQIFGRSIPAQIASVGLGLAAGAGAYLAAGRILQLPQMDVLASLAGRWRGGG